MEHWKTNRWALALLLLLSMGHQRAAAQVTQQKKKVQVQKKKPVTLKPAELSAESWFQSLAPAIAFPEFSIQEQPELPGSYPVSKGIDLHPYFKSARYDADTKELTFTFAIANWGDTDCLEPIIYRVQPMLETKQKLPETNWESREHKQTYVREIVAPGRPQQDVSIPSGKALEHTIAYDMSDPAVWSSGGIRVYIDCHFKEGSVEGDPKASYSGSHKNLAWLPVRADDFDYRSVIVSEGIGKIIETSDSQILKLELVRLKNMGAGNYQMLNTTVRHALYSIRIDPAKLIQNPDAYASFRIPIEEPVRDYRTYDNTDELRANGGDDYLKPGQSFIHADYIRQSDWEQAKTVFVWLEKARMERWLKYEHLSKCVFHK